MCNALEPEDSAQVIEMVEALGTLHDQIINNDSDTDKRVLKSQSGLLTIRLFEVAAKIEGRPPRR